MQLLELRPDLVRGKMLVWGTDNLSNAVGLLKGSVAGGGRGPAHDYLVRIFQLVDELNMHLLSVWVPREHNQRADAFSRLAAGAAGKALAAREGLVYVRAT